MTFTFILVSSNIFRSSIDVVQLVKLEHVFKGHLVAQKLHVGRLLLFAFAPQLVQFAHNVRMLLLDGLFHFLKLCEPFFAAHE